MKPNLRKALGITTGLATVAMNLIATSTGANAATVTGCGDSPVGATLTNEGSFCQVVFDTVGSHDFTLPTGISGLTALLVGGGGGSGPGFSQIGTGWGYSGQGGNVTYSDLSSQAAATVLTTVVGDGGAAATPTAQAVSGGESTISASTTVLASAAGGLGNAGDNNSVAPTFFGYYYDAKGLAGGSATNAGLNPKNDISAPTLFANLDYEYGRGGRIYDTTPGAQTIGQGGSVTAIALLSEVEGAGTAGTVILRYNVITPAAFTIEAAIDSSSTAMGSISSNGGSVTAGDTFTSIATANAGYHFDHWDCTPGSYATDSATLSFTVSEAVSCNAFFAADAVSNHQVTVTYGGTGSGSVSNLSESVVDGEQFFSAATADAGSTFDGWECTPSTYNTSDSEIGFVPSEDVTCVAMFSLNAVTSYTVNWDAAGGTVSPTSVTVNDGGFATIPTPTRAGFTFWGWTDGEGNPGQGQYVVTGNHTWTAVWQPVIEPVVAPKAIKAVFYFTGDSSKLSNSTRAQLSKIAKKLKALPGAKVAVQGFVFKTPDITRDQKLSLARAKNIVIYLRHLGVKATFTFDARGIAKQHNFRARRAELVAMWNLPS